MDELIGRLAAKAGIDSVVAELLVCSAFPLRNEDADKVQALTTKFSARPHRPPL
jgi:hypothetical protein